MSIPSWAYRGAKVVCINAAPWPWQVGANWISDEYWPAEGVTYTIRGVAPSPYSGECGLLLEEIVRPLDFCNPEEVPFSASRFRPLVSQADDLAIHFQALLNVSNPEQVEA